MTTASDEVLSPEAYRVIGRSLRVSHRLTPNALILLVDSLLLLWVLEGCPYWIGQGILGWLSFHSFCLLHECGHGTFSRSPLLNVLLGHLFGLLCGLPFHSWKYIHREHHRWAGNLDRDPTLSGLKKLLPGRVRTLVARMAWRSWVPLVALNQHLLFWLYPLWGNLSSAEKRRCAFSSLLVLGGWAGFFGLAWLPAFLVLLFLTEAVSASHHLGLPTVGGGTHLAPWEQARVTRTSYFPRPVAELFCLNFNFHVEHHLFPHLPWYQLREARRRVCAAATLRYREERGLRWVSANRRRDLLLVLGGTPLPRRPRGPRPGRRPWRPLRQALAWLPESWRFGLYRGLIRVDWRPSPSLVVKRAETEQEKTAAFRLLHDAYVQEGLMVAADSGLRVTRYHALETTLTFVALWEGKVVGTIGLIQDNLLGLPLEGIFDVSAYRAGGKRVGEVSSFAVDRNYRGDAGKILFPLTKLLWEQAVFTLKLDYLLAAVHPKRADFYRAILLMDRLSGEVIPTYAFANGNPAVGLVLDVRKAYARALEVYCGKGAQQDLFRYYVRVVLQNGWSTGRTVGSTGPGEGDKVYL